MIKFDINNYQGKVVMHCRTEEQAKIFCEYLHSVGKRWTTGDTYLSNTYYHFYKYNTCYNFIQGMLDDIAYYFNEGFRILDFEDFDWSDFMKKKEFTKKDLKNGDVVLRRDGRVEITCVETGTFISDCGWDALSEVKDDLTYTVTEWSKYDIVAVRRPNKPGDCRFDAFEMKRGTLVYERKEVEEMTLEEVCKALGKEIKIVKEKK